MPLLSAPFFSLSALRQTALEWTGKAADYYRALTSREKALVISCALLAALAVPLKAFDVARQAADSVLTASSELEEAKARLGITAGAAAETVDKRLSAVEYGAKEISSASVAKVLLAQQIDQALLSSGLTNVDVTPGETTTKLGRLTVLQFAVSSDFNWIAFTNLLRNLTKLDSRISISKVAIEEGSPPRLKLTLEIPVNISAPHRL